MFVTRVLSPQDDPLTVDLLVPDRKHHVGARTGSQSDSLTLTSDVNAAAALEITGETLKCSSGAVELLYVCVRLCLCAHLSVCLLKRWRR